MSLFRSLVAVLGAFVPVLIMSAAPQHPSSSVEPGRVEPPFAVGEILDYDLKWGVIAVGGARMQVMPMTEINGEPAWHFAFVIETSGIADRLFKVRSRIDSWVSADLQRTLLYREKNTAGRSPRDVEVSFDWTERTATYTNFGKSRPPIPLGEGPMLDPLGALYHFRALPNSAADSAVFTVFDGKKSIPMRLTPGDSERIKVAAGRYQSVLFQPETENLGGVFEEKKADSDLRLWFSQDSTRCLLQVQGDVVAGNFWAKLSRIHRIDGI